MLSTVYECLGFFGEVTLAMLHQKNLKLRQQMANTEWLLAVSLLASERRKLYQTHDCSGIIDYAEKKLELSRQKANELLSAARAMEKMPSLSEAFRLGKLSWSKVRELKRVATPETEQVWVDFAQTNSLSAVEKRVAVSPTAWKRGKALAASVGGQAVATKESVTQLLLDEKPEDNKKEPPVDDTPTLPAPNLIKVTHYLTPDEYAAYEQAEQRVRARCNRKSMKRSEVLMEWCNGELSDGTSRARARHQILMHATPDSEFAWYQTDRGLLPVDPALLKEIREQGRVIFLDAPPEISGDSSGRRDMSNELLRYIFARAGNRCERCGSRLGRLHVHHHIPVSDGGDNRPEKLEVLCDACHALAHKEDFETRPEWVRARERARTEARAGTKAKKTLARAREPDD